MSNPSEVPTGREMAETELLKTLSLGVVGDLGRLLKEQGLGRRPVKILEALIFAMFFVTEAYLTSRKGDLEAATPPLNRFHDTMIEYIFQEIFYKHSQAKDMEELKARFHQVQDTLNERYQEYRQGFVEDFRRQDRSFASTLTAFLGHLFQTPLEDAAQTEALMAPMSEKLAYFWRGCLMSLAQQPA